MVTPIRRQQLDQVQVALLAAQLRRVVAAGQQLVVAGRPDHPLEAFAQDPQRPLDVVRRVGDVAADDQPVAVRAAAADPSTTVAVLGMVDVQVADRE